MHPRYMIYIANESEYDVFKTLMSTWWTIELKSGGFATLFPFERYGLTIPMLAKIQVYLGRNVLRYVF